MRAAFRRRSREEEEESVFVSMTDMTVSFLFILMIMLAFFAQQVSNEEKVPKSWFDGAVAERNKSREELTQANQELARLQDKVQSLEEEIERLKAELAHRRQNPLERYLAQSSEARQRILEQLRDHLQMEFPELDVALSEQNDALRFQGDGLFASGESKLRPDKLAIVQTIADRLESILPCYTLGPSARWSAECNPAASVIEAVQIEGHTDSDGGDEFNLVLSANRAVRTFTTLLGRQQNLDKHLNFNAQPVLSVAGYGKMRPIADNLTLAGRATNRRIDLRIIMFTPSASAEIERMRQELGATASEQPR